MEGDNTRLWQHCECKRVSRDPGTRNSIGIHFYYYVVPSLSFS